MKAAESCGLKQVKLRLIIIINILNEISIAAAKNVILWKELSEFVFYEMTSFRFQPTNFCFQKITGNARKIQTEDARKSQLRLIWLIDNRCFLPSKITLSNIIHFFITITKYETTQHIEWYILLTLLNNGEDQNIHYDHTRNWIDRMKYIEIFQRKGKKQSWISLL